jgi:cytoskeletal protein RodZ
MGVFGDTLRQARAYKGVTIREAEQATRINRHHLAALEEERFEGLPPLIYQRGIVRNYAAYLDLDPNKLLEMFEEARGAQPDDPPVTTPFQPLDMPSHAAPNFAIIAFMVVLGGIIFAWLYSAYFASTEATSTPVEFIATVTPVKSEDRFVPSPTPRIPTPTPTSEPTFTPTPEPSPTPTTAIETSDTSDAAVSDATSDSSDVIEEPTEEPTALPENVIALKITALADIEVEVIADGVSVFSGYLAAGETTDWITATQFVVFTSDGANTQFTNDRGEDFVMTYDSGPAQFVLP